MADLDAYKADQEISLQKMQYSTSVYQAQVEGWKEKTSASVADVEMQSRFVDMNTRTCIAYSEMQVSRFTEKMQKAFQQVQIALEAAKRSGGTRHSLLRAPCQLRTFRPAYRAQGRPVHPTVGVRVKAQDIITIIKEIYWTK